MSMENSQEVQGTQPPTVLVSRGPALAAPVGQAYHKLCAFRFLQFLVIFADLGIVCWMIGGLLGLLCLAVGPCAVILFVLHARYEESANTMQIIYTFFEAIGWMVLLLCVIGPIDQLNTEISVVHDELECVWRGKAGGIMVETVSRAASCKETFRFHDRFCSVDEMSISSGNGMPAPALAVLESELSSANCNLAADLADSVTLVSITSISRGESVASIHSGKQLAAACDDLFPSCDVKGVAEEEQVKMRFEFQKKTVLHSLVSAYFRAGFLEELLKYVAVRRILFKDRVVDGGGLLMYGLAGAAGFAAMENIQYCLMHGFATAYLRMFLAIPLHCCTGMIIGIHLGYRKFLGRQYPMLVTLGVPVLVHGTYDFFLMLPQSVPLDQTIRFLLSLLTLLAGFHYCRKAWLDLERVCFVDVHALEREGRVSKSSCCCCECDCCSAWLVHNDPMLATATLHNGSADSITNSRISVGSSFTRLARRVSGQLFPAIPACQTKPSRCISDDCANQIHVNIFWPSSCPYCGTQQPAPATVQAPAASPAGP